jgi:hypothetical protein
VIFALYDKLGEETQHEGRVTSFTHGTWHSEAYKEYEKSSKQRQDNAHHEVSMVLFLFMRYQRFAKAAFIASILRIDNQNNSEKCWYIYRVLVVVVLFRFLSPPSDKYQGLAPFLPKPEKRRLLCG